jgi:hypothetical protein
VAVLASRSATDMGKAKESWRGWKEIRRCFGPQRGEAPAASSRIQEKPDGS